MQLFLVEKKKGNQHWK